MNPWVPKAGPDERIPRVGCAPFTFDRRLDIVWQDDLPDALRDEVEDRVTLKFKPLLGGVLDQPTMRKVTAAVQTELLELVAKGRLERVPNTEDWVFR